MIILGISAYFHDSSAALIIDGKIVAAAQEERFTRIKNTEVFPKESIGYCLHEAQITLAEVDHLVFFEKPFLKFERLLETYYSNAPKGWLSFLKAMPQWTGSKLFMRREIKRALREIDPSYKRQKKILFSSHHLSHAASAFYPSPYTESAILVIDAVGEWATTTIAYGSENGIELLQEMHFPHSVGMLYSAFTYYLGFKVNNGEYKLMGLAPYGHPENPETLRFIKIIKEELVTIFPDGSIYLNRSYFTFETTLRMVPDKCWEKLLGLPKKEAQAPFTTTHFNLAYAIQAVTEEIIEKLALHARKITGSTKLCLAGGVALNCVANGRLMERKIFDEIWVQPAAGDAGGSLGAALAVHYSFSKGKKEPKDQMQGALLGPRIVDKEIQAFCQENHLQPKLFDDKSARNDFVARQLQEGKIIGWVQDRMEFGPRALGARSILASPEFENMQSKLNLSIKFREDFRPFAPVMLPEEAFRYFGCDFPAAYMQFVRPILTAYRKDLPRNYQAMPLSDKLAVSRTQFQAISHVDFSSRLQVVADPNHPLYDLLHVYRKLTGNALLINTSFNRNDEPIVCTIDDAFSCFSATEMDILVVNNHVFLK